MSKRQIALQNVSSLASIGIQAIEAQKARKVWLDAKTRHNKALHAYSSETGDAYIGGEHGEPDLEIDEGYQGRRRAAKESIRQARRLRSMIAKYSAWLKEVS